MRVVPVSLPSTRPGNRHFSWGTLPAIGARCHELRIDAAKVTWRIIYRIDEDAIVILEVFEKRTRQTPQPVIDVCQRRLRDYDG